MILKDETSQNSLTLALGNTSSQEAEIQFTPALTKLTLRFNADLTSDSSEINSIQASVENLALTLLWMVDRFS